MAYFKVAFQALSEAVDGAVTFWRLFARSTNKVSLAAVRGDFEIHRFHQCAGCYAKEVQGSDEPSPALQYKILSQYRQEFDQTYYRQVDDGDG